MLDVVKSVSIENLAQQRAAVAERLAEALRLIQEADTIAQAGNLGFPDLRIHLSYRSDHSIRGDHGNALPLLIRAVDEGGWRYLMAESGLRTFMDAETRNRWDEGLHKGEIPELTPANIAATFRTMYDNRGTMFEDGVVKCFRELSWDYKTNLPQKFGKRIVLTYLCYAYGVNHGGTDKLDDLVRVFHVVDGKPEPDHRDGMYHTVSKAHRDDFAKGSHGQWPKEADTEYLSIRLFKNGNGHITFKRPDLVDQLNRIIAKRFPGALPEPK